MLIEVVISAMLVGLIAIGTFAGFDSARRVRTDQRAHAQATQLVEQDEERLRGLTTTQLQQLGTAEPHYESENGICLEKVSAAWHYYSKENTSFCEKTSFAGNTYTGLVFTVTSSAEFVTASSNKLTCEVSGGTADYIRTKSTATWTTLGSRPPVTQSSVISTPTSGGMEVKVENQDKEPVGGATVTAEGTGLSAIETTPVAGCVIFGGLQAQTDKASVVKSNWVDVNGKSPPASEEYTVATGTLGGPTAFKIAEPGSIAATFESFGAPADGLSFVAYQSAITTAPHYFVKETTGNVPEHTAELTGLFPFAKLEGTWKAEPYTVFAGDCKANEPSLVGAANKTAAVNPNLPASVNIEAPAVNVTVWEGTAGTPTVNHPAAISGEKGAMIINPECSGVTPVGASKAVTFEHPVKVSTSTGKIEAPYLYQPYAKKLEFCFVALISGKYYRYRSPSPFIENKEAKGTANIPVYIKEAKTASNGYSGASTEKLEC